MKKRFLIILVFLTIKLLGFGQEKIEFSAASYHLISKARTLEFFTDKDFRKDFLNTLDSVTKQLFSRSLSYPDNFKFKTESQDVYSLNPDLPNISKNGLDPRDKSTLYLSFDIAERPLSTELYLRDMDSIFFNELAQKKNICLYQLRAKLLRSDESVVLNKQLFVLLARPDYKYFLGFEHPFYNMGPDSFLKVLKYCLPILMDTSNESDLIQITALPAFAPDNFIQPQLNNLNKIVTTIKNDFVQYNSESGMQSLRFQAPTYELILLKGKKITPLPEKIQRAIRNQKRDYIFLWEEGRDVFANRNYKLQTIATVINDAYDKDRLPWVNLKTGLPLQFLPGNYHLLLRDTDTIARFSIQTQVTDTSKKVYFDHVMNFNTGQAVPLGFLSTSLSSLTNSHVYHYILNGTLLKKPFKILISGISGTSSIKEIFIDEKLVCIAQGVLYPEIMLVMNPGFDAELMNQLLLMAFSSLF